MKKISLILIFAAIAIFSFVSLQPSQAISTGNCGSCHSSRFQTIDLLEGDASNILPTSINVGETKTVTVVVDNLSNSPGYTTLPVSVTLSSTNGRFTVANPTYQIPSMATGRAIATWQITGVSMGSDTLSLSLSANNPHYASFSDSYSPSPAINVATAAPILNTVTVTVSDSASSAKVSGATVTLGGTAKTTDANGITTFSIASGTYSLTIAKTGYGSTSESLVISSTVNLTRTLTATPPPPPAVNTVTITVSDSASSAKISGATVTLGGTAKTTDVNGVATFSIASGTYPMTIAKTGYGSTSEPLVVSTSASIARTLTANPPPPPALNTVTITVTDSSTSTSLAGATITLGGTPKSTDANGVATFSIASGTHALTISRTGYGSTSESLVVSSTIGISRALTQNPTPPPTTNTVTITVSDSASSAKISGATVTLGGTAKTTDANGVVSFSIANGTYTMTIAKNGYTTTSETLTVSLASNIARTITPTTTPPNPPPVTPPSSHEDHDDDDGHQHMSNHRWRRHQSHDHYDD